jgi:hypothetical protein
MKLLILTILVVFSISVKAQIHVRTFRTIRIDTSHVTPTDTLTENISYTPVTVLQYKPTLHNYYISGVNADMFIILNSVSNTNTGKITINLVTGNEKIYVNGYSTFFKPAIPGIFSINYSKTSNQLTFY